MHLIMDLTAHKTLDLHLPVIPLHRLMEQLDDLVS